MKVAIIGAGWAGCAAAVEATRLGHHVTIFEASRTAGGRARRVMSSIAGQPLALERTDLLERTEPVEAMA